MVRIGFSTVFNAYVNRLLRRVAFREDHFCGIVVEMLNVRRQRSLIVADDRTGVFDSKDLSNYCPFIYVGLQEVRSPNRFNVLFVVRIVIYRHPLSNDRRNVRSPVGRSSGLVILGFAPNFRIDLYQLVLLLYYRKDYRSRW